MGVPSQPMFLPNNYQQPMFTPAVEPIKNTLTEVLNKNVKHEKKETNTVESQTETIPTPPQPPTIPPAQPILGPFSSVPEPPPTQAKTKTNAIKKPPAEPPAHLQAELTDKELKAIVIEERKAVRAQEMAESLKRIDALDAAADARAKKAKDSATSAPAQPRWAPFSSGPLQPTGVPAPASAKLKLKQTSKQVPSDLRWGPFSSWPKPAPAPVPAPPPVPPLVPSRLGPFSSQPVRKVKRSEQPRNPSVAGPFNNPRQPSSSSSSQTQLNNSTRSSSENFRNGAYHKRVTGEDVTQARLHRSMFWD